MTSGPWLLVEWSQLRETSVLTLKCAKMPPAYVQSTGFITLILLIIFVSIMNLNYTS